VPELGVFTACSGPGTCHASLPPNQKKNLYVTASTASPVAPRTHSPSLFLKQRTSDKCLDVSRSPDFPTHFQARRLRSQGQAQIGVFTPTRRGASQDPATILLSALANPCQASHAEKTPRRNLSATQRLPTRRKWETNFPFSRLARQREACFH